MGTKKLLHKMPLQKRVPLKKKHTHSQISQKSLDSTQANISLENINSATKLYEFINANKVSVTTVLKRFLENMTENAAFEIKGINEFIGICLDYILNFAVIDLISGKINYEEFIEICSKLVENINSLPVSKKWAIFEWIRTELQNYTNQINEIFSKMTLEKCLRFIIFIELVKSLLKVSDEIENPLILACISIGFKSLQIMNITNLETGIWYLVILKNLFEICNENKQTAPECLSFIKKIFTFIETNITIIQENELQNSKLNDLNLLKIMLPNEKNIQREREIFFIKSSLKLLNSICKSYSKHNLYNSILPTISLFIENLCKIHPCITKIWDTFSVNLSKEAKIKEKVKIPLQLHQEKPKEIQSFEPIIADTFLPFKMRDKNPKIDIAEKEEKQKANQAKRVEMRKMKKQSMLREELKLEENDYIKEKLNVVVKKDRKALEQEYMYFF